MVSPSDLFGQAWVSTSPSRSTETFLSGSSGGLQEFICVSVEASRGSGIHRVWHFGDIRFLQPVSKKPRPDSL